MGEPAARGRRLPDDIIATIMSKLDFRTLFEYCLEYPDDRIIPLTPSLAVTIPASEFNCDPCFGKTRFGRWCNRSLDYLIVKGFKLWCAIDGKYMPKFIRGVVLVAFMALIVRDTPTLSDRAKKFFQRLSGLKFLRLDIPALPYTSLLPPNYWFRWDAKFGVEGSLNYTAFVFGDIVDGEDENEEESDGVGNYELFQFALKHTLVHGFLERLKQDPKGLWKKHMSVMTKDVGRNGGVLVGSCLGDPIEPSLARFKLCALNGTLTLVHGSRNSVRVKDPTLMFVAAVAVQPNDIIEDEFKANDDHIMSCLGRSDEIGKPIEKREVRRVAAYILDHPEYIGCESIGRINAELFF